MVAHLSRRNYRAVKGIGPELREYKAVQQPQEGRFAGAVGAGEEDGLTGFDRLRQVTENGSVVIGKTDVVENNHERTPSKRTKR